MTKAAYFGAAAGIFHGSRAFGPPLQVSLNVSNCCNIRCIHCYYHSPLATVKTIGTALALKPPGGEQVRLTDSGQVEALIGRLLDMGVRSFVLNGHGEPFLHPDFLRFAGLIKKARRHCATNTNGTLLGPSISDELLAMQFDELRVSAMAGTAGIYAETHPESGPEAFARLRENLVYLRDEKRRRGARKPKLVLTAVIIKTNARDIPHFAQFAAEAGAEQVVFRVFDDVDDPGLKLLELDADQLPVLGMDLQRAARIFAEHRIKHNINNLLAVLRRQLDTAQLYRRIPCYYGWVAMLVDSDGSVLPCCRCYRSFGNAFQQDVRAIWYGEDYRAFRRQAGAINRSHEPPAACECRSCSNHNANIRIYQLFHPWRRRLEYAADGE